MPYEEDVVMNAFSLRSWLRYINHRTARGQVEDIISVYERAINQLPWSYKLWQEYLKYRISLTEYLGDSRPLCDLLGLYERAVMFIGKYPGHWEAYLRFLIRFKKYSLVRKTLNRALRSLPVTQHMGLWKVWLALSPPSEVNIRVFRRYIQVH